MLTVRINLPPSPTAPDWETVLIPEIQHFTPFLYLSSDHGGLALKSDLLPIT